jgi:AraC-like DNA-binding protein
MDKSCMSAFSDILDADSHSHWMLQLFYAFDNDLLIKVDDKEIKCKCIVVNTDVVHSLNMQNRLHFTMLIDITSPLFYSLKEKYLQSKRYYIFDNEKLINMQADIPPQHSINIQWYENFVSKFFDTIDITINPCIIYDKRILDAIKQLDVCDCTDHSIQRIADSVALSPSRLSHLFKEQTGMALKSYILLHMVQRAYLYLFQKGNITNAALEAGFDSPSHFAATSKKLTGISATNISKDSVFLKASYI